MATRGQSQTMVNRLRKVKRYWAWDDDDDIEEAVNVLQVQVGACRKGQGQEVHRRARPDGRQRSYLYRRRWWYQQTTRLFRARCR